MLGSCRTPHPVQPSFGGSVGKGCKRRTLGDTEHPKNDWGPPPSRLRGALRRVPAMDAAPGDARLRPAQLITAAKGPHPQGDPKTIPPAPGSAPAGSGATARRGPPRKAPRALSGGGRAVSPCHRAACQPRARHGRAALQPCGRSKNIGGRLTGSGSTGGERHRGGVGDRGDTHLCPKPAASPQLHPVGWWAPPQPRASVSPPESPKGCGRPWGSAEPLVTGRASGVGGPHARPDVVGIPTGLITGRL